MAIERWNPSPTVTPQEGYLLRRLQRTCKLFRFLREHRHEIFDVSFQDELAGMYRGTGAGIPAKAPALMAMATLLQGYVRASDAEAVELTVVDLRWQMVLDCLGATEPLFSQGALHDFRHRMIDQDMDRRLLERTAEVARRTKGFDPKKLPTLRVAVDSAPLAGAGRVEDTINLLGHAARKVVECVASSMGLNTDELCRDAGIPLLLFSSVKAGLDRQWTAPGEKAAAVRELVDQIESLVRWLEDQLASQTTPAPLQQHLETLHEVMKQDLEAAPGGGKRVRQGVAKDRRISIEDDEMRHGRKSSSKRIDGFKRHIAKDLDCGVVDACALTPANQPENEALKLISDDIEAQGRKIDELFVDRGYVTSPVVGIIIDRGGEVVCRPWGQTNGELFTKEDFAIDLKAMTATCPNGETIDIRIGETAGFPPKTCEKCPIRARCTQAKSDRGRTIRIANDEPLQMHLREIAKTPEGRARVRQRVPIEHGLAHVVQRQGHRARYLGLRTNLFDLRRACSIQNLEGAQFHLDKAA